MIKIGPYDAYVAEPSQPNSRKHDGAALLYLSDVIGIWQNSKLMADQYAMNGYYTLLVDLFNGDPVEVNHPPPGPAFDFTAWLTQGSDGKNPHTTEAVDPIVEKALNYLKERGFTNIGAVGYCFGAKVCGARDIQTPSSMFP